jgi:hypothetical protein
MTTTRKKLCIGMATFDDYDGVYFTVQAIRLFHPEVVEETEIVVIDNHPGGPCANHLKALEKWVTGYRYVPFHSYQGTSARNAVFEEANAEYVLCIDCHVLLAPGSLRRLIDYFDSHPDTPDLLQGPLIYDDLRTFSSHMNPTWSCGMYGVWGTDPRAADPAAEPFEIQMQGLGAFACRKQAWPGFHPQLRGFGGEEGYIQEKFRRAGGRTLCLPFLRWVHRFARPRGVPYPNTWEDRIRNYLLIAGELGLDPSPAIQHFRAHLGSAAEPIIQTARPPRPNPFDFFDAIYCINLASETSRWCSVSARFAHLGIAGRVRRFDAIRTQPNQHIGCGLSHRGVIAEAAQRGLANVLVFEDDVVFTSDATMGLETALGDLQSVDWKMLYLGACRWNRELPLLPGARRLAQAGPVTCSHAVAYHRSIYDRILRDVPDRESDMEQWLQTHRGIDQYFAFTVNEGKYLLSPVIASQPPIFSMEAAEVRSRLIV